MHKTKIIKIGSSSGVVLSQEMLAKLHVERGDDVFFIETSDGYKIVSYDPDFEQAMLRAKKVLRKYRDVFHMLAKS